LFLWRLGSTQKAYLQQAGLPAAGREEATIWSSEEVFGGGCFMSWLGRRKAGLYKGI